MLASKASSATSPTSKASKEPDTANQGQRSFLKAADGATPSVRPYLLPALCNPASSPHLFLTKLRQANAFHCNKTNATKTLFNKKSKQSKRRNSLQNLPRAANFTGGQGDLRASPLPCRHVGRGGRPRFGAWRATECVQRTSPLQPKQKSVRP